MARSGSHDDVGLPLKWQPVSNGEFYPPPPSELTREALRRSRDELERNARRAGVPRRRFLLSAAGSATMLSVLAACSGERARSAGRGAAGTYTVPPDATVDDEAAQEVLGGDEFIFDVQGHFLEYPDSTYLPVPEFPQAACGLPDAHDCFEAATFFDLMFNQSDTSAVVLSAIPFGEELLSSDHMRSSIEAATRVCGTGRVFMQGQANPSTLAPAELRDRMSRLAADYPIIAWKTYTHAGGPGWYLDDHDPALPAVGRPFIEHAVALGRPIIAVHKGLNSVGGNPANAPYSDPVDVGPAAAAHPEATFVIYHSGFDFGPAETAYSEGNNFGVDRLISSVRAAGLTAGSNVYAELGSTWKFVSTDPDAAAHTLGKLLVHLGEDNVVWGTDSIWYGSPQDQIEAFRAFEITPEFQERFGYPALTPQLKAKILGLTSARLYGVDPTTVPCRLSADDLSAIRQAAGTKNRTLGPTTATAVDELNRGGD